ncbi:MAG: ABC transporter permease [Actinomycetota bacterium]|jgi:peptide/nickel transport system permease protein|nr:ABC transporter permease [Actinomycetota bacterium]
MIFMILVLWIVSVVTFLIFVKLPPGDPARRATGGRGASAEQIEAARHAFGLDRPVLTQYARFAKGLIPWPGLWLNKEVYFSYGSNVPVWEQIKDRLPVTLTLAFGAAVVWLALGIPIGIVSAVRRRSWVDRASMIFALVGVSAPVFWLGLLFLFVFWYKLGWLPGSGIPLNEGLATAVLTGRFILPWIVVSLTFAAFYARMVRGNLIEAMGEDYIRTARAKGLPERTVIFRHGLRSALTPVVTMFGLDLGLYIAGAFITEKVFNLPGVGLLAVRSIFNADFPMVMGITVLGSFVIVVANLVVDVAYAFLDPRVRYT